MAPPSKKSPSASASAPTSKRTYNNVTDHTEATTQAERARDEKRPTPELKPRGAERTARRSERVSSTNTHIKEGVIPDLAMLDYRVKSRDENGMPARWSIQVPPSFDAEVRRMVDAGRYFEDLGSMIRWCVFFGMDYLQRLIEPPFPSNVQVLKAMAADNAHFETRLQYLSALERTAVNAYEAMGRGMHSTAVQIISRQLDNIRRLPPDDEFRREMVRMIKERFGHLLKKGQLVKFDELDEE